MALRPDQINKNQNKNCGFGTPRYLVLSAIWSGIRYLVRSGILYPVQNNIRYLYLVESYIQYYPVHYQLLLNNPTTDSKQPHHWFSQYSIFLVSRMHPKSMSQWHESMTSNLSGKPHLAFRIWYLVDSVIWYHPESGKICYPLQFRIYPLSGKKVYPVHPFQFRSNSSATQNVERFVIMQTQNNAPFRSIRMQYVLFRMQWLQHLERI